MKYNVNLQNLANKVGIQRMYNVPQRYIPTYVLYESNGRNITVSDMLKQIEYTVRFIKNNFNVDQQKYKETLEFLKMCELRFQNKSPGKPRKSMAHFAVDVFHEIQDLHANNEAIKKKNEDIAMILDLLIDMFAVD